MSRTPCASTQATTRSSNCAAQNEIGPGVTRADLRLCDHSIAENVTEEPLHGVLAAIPIAEPLTVEVAVRRVGCNIDSRAPSVHRSAVEIQTVHIRPARNGDIDSLTKRDVAAEHRSRATAVESRFDIAAGHASVTSGDRYAVTEEIAGR